MFSAMIEISPASVYGAVVAGIECGGYASFGVETGDEWRAAWEAVDRGEAECFARVRFFDREDPEAKLPALTDAKLAEGLRILGKLNPRALADVANEQGDALTGDALIQCALLGSVVYG